MPRTTALKLEFRGHARCTGLGICFEINTDSIIFSKYYPFEDTCGTGSSSFCDRSAPCPNFTTLQRQAVDRPPVSLFRTEIASPSDTKAGPFDDIGPCRTQLETTYDRQHQCPSYETRSADPNLVRLTAPMSPRISSLSGPRRFRRKKSGLQYIR